MASSIRDLMRTPRPFDLVGVLFTGIAVTALVGAITNAVNALVSPRYFVTILGWQHLPPDAIWRASVAQGAFEGLLVGLFLSAVFTTGTGIITGACCTYLFAAKHLLGIVAGAVVFWILGGLAAMGLAALSPEFYRAAFIGVPDDFDAMLGYAWVGGSIWGIQLGGLLSVVVSLVVLRTNWRGERLPS